MISPLQNQIMISQNRLNKNRTATGQCDFYYLETLLKTGRHLNQGVDAVGFHCINHVATHPGQNLRPLTIAYADLKSPRPTIVWCWQIKLFQ